MNYYLYNYDIEVPYRKVRGKTPEEVFENIQDYAYRRNCENPYEQIEFETETDMAMAHHLKGGNIIMLIKRDGYNGAVVRAVWSVVEIVDNNGCAIRDIVPYQIITSGFDNELDFESEEMR